MPLDRDQGSTARHAASSRVLAPRPQFMGATQEGGSAASLLMPAISRTRDGDEAVEPLTAAQIKRLDLRRAAEEEAAAARNLLPAEPWQEIVAAKPGYFASWVSTRIQSGSRNSQATVVNARKAHQAIRPIPIVGIAERIILRGLANWIFGVAETSNDTVAPYRDFVIGPLISKLHTTAEWLNPNFESLSNDYVVQADIAAFYQYVDHNVLLNELQMQTENVDGSIRLVELLAEIQGATYGLPQLLDPSDRLAGVYMGIIERDLRRRGHVLWRYNDDFRISVTGYAAALQVLEDLSSVAHSVGLILNESKTSIVKFETYYFRHASTDRLEEGDELTADTATDIEVAEYSDDDELERLEVALKFFKKIGSFSPDSIDLKDLTYDTVRDLRRSLNTLKRNENIAAIPHLENIARFVPQLTPTISNYIIALSESESDDNHLQVWHGLTLWAGGFNAWQRAWLVYVARRCGYTSDADCRAWIRSQLAYSERTLLHAEAALALARADSISFDELDQYLRTQPEPLVPWYLLAIDGLDSVPADRVEAVRQSSTLGRLLLGD